MKLPTDRAVLECIFKMYESSYLSPVTASGQRRGGPYVAIDIPAVAQELGCNAELLFGRLYYHLDHKYRYKQDDGTTVSLFELKVGEKRHAVQFPYLAAFPAGANQELRRFLITFSISTTALLLSIVSLVLSVIKH